MNIDTVIEDVLGKEGGYVNNPADRGGATRWGITEAVARAAGWKGAMRDLPRDYAKDIYRRRYVYGPRFDDVATLSEPIAGKLVDAGVNMGPPVATTMLQRLLNALNRLGKDYGDIVVDGLIGPGTLAALKAYLRVRGAEGETVLLSGLNHLQGERYVDLAEKRPANEAFLYGWLRTRCGL